MEKIFDVAIVGGGPAGYTAALAFKNFRRDFVFFGAEEFATVASAENVRNFPGFSGTGKELKELFLSQAEREGIQITPARIDRIYKTGNRFLLTEKEKMFSAKAVILATGVVRKANLAGEREFSGRGVSYCAVCDGALYRAKKIAAVVKEREFEEEAEYLAGFAEKVYAFCGYENPHFRAQNIEVVESYPTAIEGEGKVERILFQGGEKEVSGVFLIGKAMPPSALVGGLKEENGHVKVERDMSTNLKGLFAAGDVTGRPYQYVKAAGEGLVAAFSAQEYLIKIEKS